MTPILFVTAAGDRGGAEVAMERIAGGLRAAGRFQPVMAVPDGSRLLSAWRDAGFDVVPTPPVRRLRSAMETWHVADAVASAVKTQNIALVYTHGVGAELHGGLGAWRAGCPLVVHAHDMFDPTWSRNGLLHRLAARVPRAATVADSNAVARSLAPRSVDVIYPPIESAILEPVPHDGPLVAWCGRLQRWKGCHLFLEAARHARPAR